MSVKSDKWIRRNALENKMIEPFEDRQVRDGVISYGVSSYGYDMRVADEFVETQRLVGKRDLASVGLGEQIEAVHDSGEALDFVELAEQARPACTR